MDKKRSTGQSFSTEVRIYYEDTDAGGVVYHSNYIKFMERARTEFLRHLGVGQMELMARKQLFMVAECSVKFRRSAMLDDLLQVTTEMETVGKVRLVFKQKIFRGEQLLCDGRIVVGSIHSDTMRPVAICEELRNKLLSMMV